VALNGVVVEFDLGSLSLVGGRNCFRSAVYKERREFDLEDMVRRTTNRIGRTSLGDRTET
jgi:hypothetical protein